MNKKIALLFVLSLMIGMVSSVSAQRKKAKPEVKPRVSPGLASFLPSSDAVISLNAKRLINEALPQILAEKPQELAKFNDAIAQIRSDYGIDVRLFEEVAAGIAIKKISDKENDFEPVMLAKGNFSSGAMIALAKIAAKGRYREEKAGERIIYIFSPREILQDQKPQLKTGIWEKLLKGFSSEMAITAFNENTLAIGSLERVKQAFTESSSINGELLSLAGKRQGAVMNFGAITPNGMNQFFDLENDEIGKMLGSIKSLQGFLDMGDGNALLNLAAKSSSIDQARAIEDALLGIQMIGKSFLGGVKGNEKEVYARMIEGAVISRVSSEVSLDLKVLNSDLNLLMAKIF